MAEKEIRTIMASLRKSHVLLPSSAVAEVLAFSSPAPFKDAPAWLLGELHWRGWQVPIISLMRLLDEDHHTETSSKNRILIVKTLGESTQVCYIGLIIQGLPKLKTVSAHSLLEQASDALPDALFSQVKIGEDTAMIPELGHLTRMIEQAAYAD